MVFNKTFILPQKDTVFLFPKHDISKCRNVLTVSHWRSQNFKNGGGKYLPKSLNDLFCAFSEKISAFPQNVNYIPEFLMTFYSHRPFHVLMCYFSVRGAKSVADIDTG